MFEQLNLAKFQKGILEILARAKVWVTNSLFAIIIVKIASGGLFNSVDTFRANSYYKLS